MSSSVSPGGWGTLRDHLELARISNSPTVVSNVLAGAALAGAVQTGEEGGVFLVIVAMVLFYTAGMYLNDLFDLEVDRRERPERPLPSRRVSKGAAGAVVTALFTVGCLLLALLGWRPLVSGLVLVGLIVLYDAWHKTNPLSPLLMASTRVMVYVTAFLAFSVALTTPLIIWAALLGLYIVGLTYISKTESRPGLTRYWPALLLVLPAVYAAAQSGALPVLALVLGFVGWTLYSASFVYVRRQIGGAVARLIAGVSLVDALVLAVTGALGGVVVALLAFALTLFLQRYVRGT